MLVKLQGVYHFLWILLVIHQMHQQKVKMQLGPTPPGKHGQVCSEVIPGALFISSYQAHRGEIGESRFGTFLKELGPGLIDADFVVIIKNIWKNNQTVATKMSRKSMVYGMCVL